MRRSALILAGGLAVAVGLAGGLFYTWVLDPVEYYDSPPEALYLQDQIVYLALIGDMYAYEGDLELARQRLEAIGVEAEGPLLAERIEQYLAAGGRTEEVRSLARLAEALGASGGVLLVFGPLPTLTSPPTARPQPQIGATPTPPTQATPLPAFQLLEQTTLCAKAGRPGMLLIQVQDAAGRGLAGVEVVVSWANGQDRFFTGLYPELGPGYADFEMAPRQEYEVALAGFRGDTVRGLTSTLPAGVCPAGTRYQSWRLVFQQLP